jgi:hypothetical protein
MPLFLNTKSLRMVEMDTTLHIGKIAFSYYQVQRSTPNEQDFREWIDSLQEPDSSMCRTKGFEAALLSTEFIRFFIGIRDREMIAYMQERLNEQDFLYWLAERHRPCELPE